MTRVEVTAALLGVAERDEDLGRDEAAGAGKFLVGMGEPDLPDRCGRLALLELERALRQLQGMAAERDGAGRHQHDLLALRGERGHVVDEGLEPRGFQRAGRAVGEQRRADLDDDALRLRPFGAGGRRGGVPGGFDLCAHSLAMVPIGSWRA